MSNSFWSVWVSDDDPHSAKKGPANVETCSTLFKNFIFIIRRLDGRTTLTDALQLVNRSNRTEKRQQLDSEWLMCKITIARDIFPKAKWTKRRAKSGENIFQFFRQFDFFVCDNFSQRSTFNIWWCVFSSFPKMPSWQCTTLSADRIWCRSQWRSLHSPHAAGPLKMNMRYEFVSGRRFVRITFSEDRLAPRSVLDCALQRTATKCAPRAHRESVSITAPLRRTRCGTMFACATRSAPSCVSKRFQT